METVATIFRPPPPYLLGHSDVSLTLNIYSHVLPDMGDAAVGAMDDALG